MPNENEIELHAMSSPSFTKTLYLVTPGEVDGNSGRLTVLGLGQATDAWMSLDGHGREHFSLLGSSDFFAVRQTAKIVGHRTLEMRDNDAVKVCQFSEFLPEIRTSPAGVNAVYVGSANDMRHFVGEIDAIGLKMGEYGYMPDSSESRFISVEEAFASPCAIVVVKFNNDCTAISYSWWDEYQ